MIYFVQDSLTFRIKIGFTGKDNAAERLSELQTGSSSLLYLLATRPGTKRTEQDLHEQFSQYHTQGEWFSPGPLLINYVVGCAAVEMAQIAVANATADLLARSFPETKAEIQARADEAKRLLAARQAEEDRKREEEIERYRKERTQEPLQPYQLGTNKWGEQLRQRRKEQEGQQ